MKKLEEFRKRARECRDLSVKAPAAEMREHYRHLAEMWDRLADERVNFLLSKEIEEAG
jgi:hypothetical protein